MKTKIIALFCVVMITLGMMPSSLANEQAPVAYNQEYYNLLHGIGIIDSSLMPFNSPEIPVTRGEMATFVARMLGMDIQDFTYSGPYSDVFPDNLHGWAITFVTNQGVMSGKGDGNFYPDDAMLWEEAVKTLVYALGYGPFSGNWHDGVMAKAASIGLMANLSAKIGQPISRADAATLLYNALDIDLMEQTVFVAGREEYVISKDCTVLSKYLDISIGEGVVTKNFSTGLTESTGLDAAYVEIDGRRFRVGNTNAGNYLGYCIEYYSKPDNGGLTDTLLYINAAGLNDELIIEAEDISGYENFQLSYMVDSKKRNVKLTNTTDVIYNNSPVPLSKEYLEISDGRLKLIDNDGNGLYDVVISEEFSTLVVDMVDYDNEIIYNKYSTTEHLPYGDAEVYFKSPDGSGITPVEITEWDVLSVMRSADNSKIYAYVTINEISGTVEAKSADGGITYTVNGRRYKIAGDVEIYEEIELGRKYIFYLDYLGRIAAVRDIYDDNFRLAYVIAKSRNGSINPNVLIKLLDEEGEVEVLTCSDKIEVDEMPYDGADRIESVIQSICGEVVRYRKNADGEVKEIQTSSGAEILKTVTNENLNYRSNARVFYGKAILDGESVIFRVPDSGEDDKYYVGNINSAIFSNDVNYTIDAYVLRDKLAAAAIVSPYSTIVTDDATIGYTAPFMIIDKIIYTSDEDGEDIPTLCGIAQTAYRELSLSDSSVMDNIKRHDGADSAGISLTKGDIIRYSLDVNGKINGIQLMYRAKDKTYCSTNNINDNFTRGIRLFEGIVYDTDGANFEVAKTTDLSMADSAERELQGTNGGFVVVYDSSLGRDGDMFVAGVSDMHSYKAMPASADRVFICTTSGHPRAVYIIR